MLANDPIYASLPATDLEHAKLFYSEKLGLTPESELPGGHHYSLLHNLVPERVW
jgi:predicted enzyme related to lactoylglutathione lyase